MISVAVIVLYNSKQNGLLEFYMLICYALQRKIQCDTETWRKSIILPYEKIK